MSSTEVSKFLISSRYITATIAIIVFFSAIFLVSYQPFSLTLWFTTGDIVSILFTLLFYVAAIVLLIISRWTMYSIQDRYELTSTLFILWVAGEIMAITLLYTFVTNHYFNDNGVALADIALRALFCVTIIIAIPNIIVSCYARYRSKCEELEAAQYEIKRLDEENNRLINQSVVERRINEMLPKSEAHQTPRMVQFYDNGGTLRLTIDLNALYYLESEDNYINVHYKHNDKINSYLLRCKTSTVERSLEGTVMVRCHRSYIVNTRKIRFMGEEHRMHFLTLDDDSIKRIPVSKSYYQTLLASLNTIGIQQPKEQPKATLDAL